MPPDPDAPGPKNRRRPSWYTPPVVHGTAYGAMSRAPADGWDGAEIDRLYAVAPLQIRVAQMEVKRLYGEAFTLDQYQKTMGPLADYFAAAIEQAQNSTGLSADQQSELINKHAAVYSSGYTRDRLASMLEQHEQAGNLSQAEEDGQKIQEQYNDIEPLAGFYKRQAEKGDARYQSKLDNLALTIFPDGLKKVTLASFSGPPSSGIKFSSTTEEMTKAGLSADQVIVALDGYGAQNQDQYTFLRALSGSPEMHFIVWDGKTYRELTANQPGRRFGVDIVEYHP